jgi:hypothetical protein
MPLVFRRNGYRFHFFSNEGSPREPAHIHVEKGDADTKFWLFPEVEVAYNHGFSAKTLRLLGQVIEERRGDIVEAWNGYFG